MTNSSSSKTESCAGGLGCCNSHGDCPQCGCAGKINRLTRERDKWHSHYQDLLDDAASVRQEMLRRDAERDRLAQELRHLENLQDFSAPLSCHTHGLVPNLGLFDNKCPACERDRLRAIVSEQQHNCSCPYGDCSTCEKAKAALSGEPSAHETTPRHLTQPERDALDRALNGSVTEVHPGILDETPSRSVQRREAAMRGEPAPEFGQPVTPKRAYYQTHDSPHCPSCSCGIDLPKGFVQLIACKGCGVKDEPGARHFSGCPIAARDWVRPELDSPEERLRLDKKAEGG